MGWILRRYLLGEVLALLALGLLVTTFILATIEVVDLVDLAFAKGVPAWRIATIFAYMVPAYLELTVPMALLLSIVAAFARLVRDGEMLALRAAGMSLLQLARPILALSAGVAVVSFGLAAWASPRANAALDLAVTDMAKTRVTAALTPGIFSAWINGVVVYIGEVDRRSGRIKDAIVADNRDEARPRTIFAEHGRLFTDDVTGMARFFMRKGTILERETVRSYDRTDFRRFELNVRLATEAAETGHQLSDEPRRLDWGLLLASKRDRLARGLPTLDQEIEIQRRVTLAFACMLLPLIGIPLGAQRTRASRSRGIVAGLGAISIYYFLLTAAVTLAHKGLLGAVPALWAPNVALLLTGAIALGRAVRDGGGRRRGWFRPRAGGGNA